MVELENKMYYWIKDKQNKKIYVGKYDADWADGVFDITGSDDIHHKDEFYVLEKVKIPKYINGNELG